MAAKEKLAQKRLTLLQLAEKLGNVSKACLMHRVSRSQFYEYKRASRNTDSQAEPVLRDVIRGLVGFRRRSPPEKQFD